MTVHVPILGVDADRLARVKRDLAAAEAELIEAGAAWKEARALERAASSRTHDAIRAAVAAGMTEVDAAAFAGVDRMTVRRALGKL